MDVLALSWFTSAHWVGVYSFLLLFADGLMQLLVVVRRNVNPLITQYALHDRERLRATFAIVNKRLLLWAPLLSLGVFAAFLLGCVLLGRQAYLAGVPALAVLLVSMALNSVGIVFGGAMSQAGFPRQESLLNLATILTNLGANLLLIPAFGILGAAVATALSYCVFSLVLSRQARRHLQVRLYGRRG